MRKIVNYHSGRVFSDRKWKVPFFTCLLVSVTLFSATICVLYSSSYGRDQVEFDVIPFDELEDSSEYFVESDLRSAVSNAVPKTEPPRFAYLISGTKGDSQRLLRTLQAVYHPRNQYILHMDLEAPPRERLNLTMSVKNDPTFREVKNVRLMEQSNLVTYKGPTMIATTLQAISIMLKESSDWDWFINLSASDYPANNGIDFESVSLDLDCAYGISNRNPSIPLGDAEVIALSDSDEENEPPVLHGNVQGNNKADSAIVPFLLQQHGIPDSYHEDPAFANEGNSCPGLFGTSNNDFEMHTWHLSHNTQGGPGFQLFGSDADVSGSFAVVQPQSIDFPSSIDRFVFLTDETMGSVGVVPDSSVGCHLMPI